uniref:NADH dehydrogenase subunit 6 n=1 Tax=Cyanoplax caverna TaxID=1503210 RepID=A0A0E3DEF2_9MOLL|nr:NADH dehydrogenase subunit 6 [Cyanoplax caverna]AIA77060.1 NADH dehydrogenase subunit 6 [Cyanoplax caverna]
MTFLMFVSSILSLCFFMPFLIQPIGLGFILLLLSLLVSSIVYFGSVGWFGFILFLIYIGGMIVMFIYVMALMPNLMFKKTLLILFFFMLNIFWFTVIYFSNFLVFLLEEQYKMDYVSEMYLNLLGSSLFSEFNCLMVVGLAVILFLVLIGVVKICYFVSGPMRSYKYA